MLAPLVAAVGRGECVPIVGWGLSDGLVGTRRLLAADLTAANQLVLHGSSRVDLSYVAQLLCVIRDVPTVRYGIDRLLRARFNGRHLPAQGPLVRSTNSSRTPAGGPPCRRYRAARRRGGHGLPRLRERQPVQPLGRRAPARRRRPRSSCAAGGPSPSAGPIRCSRPATPAPNGRSSCRCSAATTSRSRSC